MYHPFRSDETIRQHCELSYILDSKVTNAEVEQRLADAKRRRRLLNVRAYLRERAARKG